MIIPILINISCPQITKSNTSITIQGDYKIWPTQKRSQDQSDNTQLEEVLQKIKSEANKAKEAGLGFTGGIIAKAKSAFDGLLNVGTNSGGSGRGLLDDNSWRLTVGFFVGLIVISVAGRC